MDSFFWLASAELANLGFETSFEVCPIDTADPKIWRGVKRRYWWGSQYFLPTCTLEGGESGGIGGSGGGGGGGSGGGAAGGSGGKKRKK